MSANQATERPAPARGRRPLQTGSVGCRVAAPGLLGLVGLAAVAKESAAAAQRSHEQVTIAAAVDHQAATTTEIAREVTTTVRDVSLLTVEMAVGAEGVRASGGRLASTAEVLERVLVRFRISSSPAADAAPLGAGR